MRIRSRLSALMREKGIGEKELFEKTGVRRNTIRGLARDMNLRIDLVVVEKLATALGVRPLDLLEETEDPRGPGMPTTVGTS
jgi:DNA-binding Xre family transcriptional regulator